MIKYLTYQERPIEAYQLKQLYNNADWWPERNEEAIEKMLQNCKVVGAWNDTELVGFARAVTDGYFRAYIEDVVIHTHYQRKSIGTQLMDKLLKQLEDIDLISLFCKEDLISFYEINNFKSFKSQRVLHLNQIKETL